MTQVFQLIVDFSPAASALLNHERHTQSFQQMVSGDAEHDCVRNPLSSLDFRNSVSPYSFQAKRKRRVAKQAPVNSGGWRSCDKLHISLE